jgi:hypothetical protein
MSIEYSPTDYWPCTDKFIEIVQKTDDDLFPEKSGEDLFPFYSRYEALAEDYPELEEAWDDIFFNERWRYSAVEGEYIMAESVDEYISSIDPDKYFLPSRISTRNSLIGRWAEESLRCYRQIETTDYRVFKAGDLNPLNGKRLQWRTHLLLPAGMESFIRFIMENDKLKHTLATNNIEKLPQY